MKPQAVREFPSSEALSRAATQTFMRRSDVAVFERSLDGAWVEVGIASNAMELEQILAAHPACNGLVPRATSASKLQNAAALASALSTVAPLRPVEESVMFHAARDLLARGFRLALMVHGAAITTQAIVDEDQARHHCERSPEGEIGIRLGKQFAALRFGSSLFSQKALALFKSRGWLDGAACIGSANGSITYLFKIENSTPTMPIARGVQWFGSGAIEAPPSQGLEWFCETPPQPPHHELLALLIEPSKRLAIREQLNDPSANQFIPKGADPNAVDLLEQVTFGSPCPGRPGWDGPAADGLAAVFIGPDEYRVGTSVIEAIARDSDLYRRGRNLVIVDRGEYLRGLRAKTNVCLGPAIVDLDPDGLRSLITRSCALVRRSQKDGTIQRVHPPSWLTGNIMSRARIDEIPPLDGVRETPVMRADGTVLSRPGYDSETAMLLLENGVYPEIPDEPTQDDARIAAATLSEAFCDFPFETEADRSAAMAAVLTFFARPAYAGPTPLFFVEANKAGTGKGLLVDVITMIALGRPVERQTASEEEDEMRKRITSILRAGLPLGFIDNIDAAFGGPSLDAVITSEVWSDRILGANEMVRMQNRTVWICTGNNPEFRGDMSRRICRIRMVTPEQNPELREGYKHEDPREWVKKVRPHLIRAALTILRAYHVARQPKVDMRRWGSFEGWSQHVRAALVFAGCADPAPESWRLEEMSPQVSAERMLIIGIRELLSSEPNGRASAARILQKLQQNDRAVHAGSGVEQWLNFRSACEELFSLRPGQLPNARALGRRLTKCRDANIVGNILRAEQNQSQNLLEYYVESAQKSDATQNATGDVDLEPTTIAPVIARVLDTADGPSLELDYSDNDGEVAAAFEEFPPLASDPMPTKASGPPEIWPSVETFLARLEAESGDDEAIRVEKARDLAREIVSINRKVSVPFVDGPPREKHLVLAWSSRLDNNPHAADWWLRIAIDDSGLFDWEFSYEASNIYVGNPHPLDWFDGDLVAVVKRLDTIG